jgi:hypothetical protein
MNQTMADKSLPAAAFRARLGDPALRKMLDHWLKLAAAQAGAAPSRARFDPAAIPTLLRHLQLHQREADGRFRCRLSGTAIVAALDRDATGTYLDQAIRPEAVAGRTRLYNRALETGRPVAYSGVIDVPGRGLKAYQRLLLPFAGAHGTPEFVLSVMAFRTLGPTDAGRLNDPQEVAELGREAGAGAAAAGAARAA